MHQRNPHKNHLLLRGPVQHGLHCASSGRNEALAVSGGVSPLNYHWSNSQTTANISNLTFGTYSLTVTDLNGCSGWYPIVITQPEREDWTMSGNANTNPANQFIGTSDSVPLSFRTNNVERFKIKADGILNASKLSGNGTGFLMADSTGNFLKQSVGPIVSSVAWMVSGNNINSNNFLGSLNNVDLNFKTNSNNSTGMVLTTSGDLKLKKYEFAANGIFTNSAGYIDKIDFTTASDVLCGDGIFHSINTVSAGVWNVNNTVVYKNGSVGINTPTPSKTLEVAHDILDGGLAINKLNTGNFKSEISFRQNGNEKWALGVDKDHNNNDNFFIWNNTRGTQFYINNASNIGIGTTTPSEKLEVIGKGKFTNLQATALIGNTGKIVILDANGNLSASNVTTNNLLQWPTHAGGIFYNSGKVFIGMSTCTTCTSASYDLYVGKGIATRDVLVTAGAFPDYVFNEDYKLMSIYELESYINQHQHLPEIPSASEVEKNHGFEIGDLITKLVKKSEEQSLYIIELQKQIDLLCKKVDSISKNK